jgi:hypothetical protein
MQPNDFCCFVGWTIEGERSSLWRPVRRGIADLLCAVMAPAGY